MTKTEVFLPVKEKITAGLTAKGDFSMRMKRFLTAALAAAMVLSMTACGGSNEDTAEEGQTNETTVQEAADAGKF